MKQMTTGTKLRGEFVVQGKARRLPPSCEENLMRIQQETLTNALKHSGARTIKVTLSFEEHRVVLAVQDDGIGFDLSERHEGFGLLGIQERATQMKGELRIVTEVGHGTQICVALPYQSQTREFES